MVGDVYHVGGLVWRRKYGTRVPLIEMEMEMETESEHFHLVRRQCYTVVVYFWRSMVLTKTFLLCRRC